MISFFKIDDRRFNAAVIREYGPSGETNVSITPLSGKVISLSFPDQSKRDEVLNAIDLAMCNLQQNTMVQVRTT